MKYRYIRLYRLVDSDQRVTEEEVRKLADFIKHRASLNNKLSYYVITIAERNSTDGLVVISGVDENRVNYEVDLIVGFVESSLKTIKAKVVDTDKIEYAIPLPGRARNF